MRDYSSPQSILLRIYFIDLYCTLALNGFTVQILNLLVAIVIDNFDYILRDKSILSAHQLDIFVKLWSLYDPDAR